VVGSAQFADDIQFGPGLLYARIKRSDRPHARIKRVDVSKARALPGVKAVVTGEDYPGMMGLYLTDRHIFCRDRVRYVGDPVAGVAAISEEIAEQAVDLIEVEYEDLPGVFDPEPGAPSRTAELIHPNLGSYEGNFIFRAGTNISTISASARATWMAPGRSALRSSSTPIAFRTSSMCRSSRT
jgi:carbon-monoxide dehydrogenase large subunit